jgi:predicted metal-dependent hydrolase
MGRTLPRDRYGRPLPRGSRDELIRADEAAAGSTRQACRRGIALFDERRFFEAHECFEHAWKAGDVDERDRPFWKGVTQVAVGCCHVQRGNDRGAVALLERGAGYLERFPTPHRGIDTGRLVRAARELAERVRRRGASPGLGFPRFPVRGS